MTGPTSLSQNDCNAQQYPADTTQPRVAVRDLIVAWETGSNRRRETGADRSVRQGGDRQAAAPPLSSILVPASAPSVNARQSAAVSAERSQSSAFHPSAVSSADHASQRLVDDLFAWAQQGEQYAQVADRLLADHLRPSCDPGIRSLDVSGLDNLPHCINSFGSIRSITTDRLRLPDNIDRMQQLEELNIVCSSNAAEQRSDRFPSLVSLLPGLRTLKIQNSALEALPSEITRLSNLESLTLNGNRNLQSLPETIGSMQSLLALNLNNNNIQALPETIGRLSHLSWLEADGNRLRSLPQSITALQRLHYISLNANRLTTLPDGLSAMRRLTDFYAEGNQLDERTSRSAVSGIRNVRIDYVEREPSPPPHVIHHRSPAADWGRSRRSASAPRWSSGLSQAVTGQGEVRRNGRIPTASAVRHIRPWLDALDQHLSSEASRKLEEMTLTSAFKMLLFRLGHIPHDRTDTHRPILARRVVSLLEKMANDAELKKRLENYCAELNPANACTDYVITNFDSLQRAAKHHMLAKDHSHQGMSDFAQYLVRCHRLAKVDKLAHEAIASLRRGVHGSRRHIDDVEELLQIRLALQSRLDLQLDFDRADTRWTQLARVSQKTVREIGDKVLKETSTPEQQLALLASDPEWRRVIDEMDDEMGAGAKARRQEASAALMDQYDNLEDPGFTLGIEAINNRFYEDATREFVQQNA